MARVPFVGRLFWREYIALLGSLLLVALESIIRVITLGLPQPILRFCYNRSKTAFNWLSPSQGKQSRSVQRSLVESIANCSDFVDLCSLFGFVAEEHILQTGDGYLLGLHRLSQAKGEDSTIRFNAGEYSTKKPVVYLHHGLLMNSEVWICMTEEERCLPFALVQQGYDVWLGNNRGNKYSKKSSRVSPTSNEFWDFSIDQFAFHDIPDSIDYILATTKCRSLSYIGFSQGTAQAFASLSTHPTLNDKVDVFIALAPAMSPAGLRNGVVDALVKASPEVLFLAFGRRSLLSSTTMWQSILYPPIYVHIIDLSLNFLFHWTAKNISFNQKLAAYPHLYSFTSTKSVVHWFQIIRNKCFQMYDDDVQTPMSVAAKDRYYKVAKFPTRNIRTPIVLIYGGSDSLVDIQIMLKELPRHTIAKEIPHFEHLDFLWAEEVHKLVFPHIFDALQVFTRSQHLKAGQAGNRTSSGHQLLDTPPRDNCSLRASRFPQAFTDNYPRRKPVGSECSLPPFLSMSTDPSSTSGDDTVQKTRHPLPEWKTSTKQSRRRGASSSSLRSFDGAATHFSEDGISIGASKATTGIMNTNLNEAQGRRSIGRKKSELA